MKAAKLVQPGAVRARGQNIRAFAVRGIRRRSSALLCGASLGAVALLGTPFAAVAQNQTVY